MLHEKVNLRLYSVWLYLYNIIAMTKLQNGEHSRGFQGLRWGGVHRKWVWLTGNMRDCPGDINVSILILTMLITRLWYSIGHFERYYSWGKLQKGLCEISLYYFLQLWIYSHLKRKFSFKEFHYFHSKCSHLYFHSPFRFSVL
jgi:hypothetical protein